MVAYFSPHMQYMRLINVNMQHNYVHICNIILSTSEIIMPRLICDLNSVTYFYLLLSISFIHIHLLYLFDFFRYYLFDIGPISPNKSKYFLSKLLFDLEGFLVCTLQIIPRNTLHGKIKMSNWYSGTLDMIGMFLLSVCLYVCFYCLFVCLVFFWGGGG